MELTDRELRAPVVKTIEFALSVLMANVLKAAESKKMSPAMNELTLSELIDVTCEKSVVVVIELANTVLNCPVRLSVLLTFKELTLSVLMDPLRNVNALPAIELTSIVLKAPSCDAM
jgi:hypothetical protein